jgi:hypothetical protein
MPSGIVSISAPANYYGPGDLKSDWSAWGGLRAYKQGSRGTPCVDIYNTVSTTTQTFNTLPNGDLDKASIATFLGGNPGKVAKLWDQTGNGLHWTQATPANMPDYVASVPSLGGRPGMFFTRSLSTVLASINNGLSTTTGSMSVTAGRMGDDRAVSSNVFASGTSSTGILFPSGTDQVQGFAGTSAPQPCLDLSSHAIDCVFNGASSFSCINGTVATYNAGSNSLNGSNFKIGQNLTGVVAEAGFHPSVLSQSEATAQNTNKTDYWFSSTLREGFVATRARRLETSDTTNQYVQSRSGHVATETLTAIAIAFESLNGAAVTLTQAIEYPAGTFTQVKWLGASSFTFGSNYTMISDYIPVSIPAGATFWIRSYYAASIAGTGVFYNTWQNSFYGEATTLSTTALTDLTMGGTITNSGAYSMPPCAVIGMTVNPSWMVTGDSIAMGVGDAEDATNTASGHNGQIGIVARSFGTVPFLNHGVSGSNAFPSGCKRLLTKATHVINEVGVNNLRGGTTAVGLTASVSGLLALLKPKQKRYQTTITMSGTDAGTPAASWTTTAQQTTHTSNSERAAFNASLRNSTSGLALTGVIDVCSVLEAVQDGGKWVVTPAPPYTGDGLHPNVAGYAKVQAANLVPTAVWP